MPLNDGFGGKSFDELVESLPRGERVAVECIVAEAGTSDADWAVWLAAAKLVTQTALASGVDFVPTETLLVALLERFDHAVFSAIQIPTDTEQAVVRRWKGNAVTCAGLGAEISRTVLSDLEARSQKA